MTRAGATALGLITAALAMAALPAGAHACSCAFADEADRFEGSDAAVVMRLTEVEPVGEGSSARLFGITATTADYHYRITRVFKGPRRLDEGDRLVIRSSTSDASCGLPTREGRYAMYLFRHRKRLTANLCTLTNRKAMANAAEEVGAQRPASGSSAGCPPG
jgi:hypothetical protein